MVKRLAIEYNAAAEPRWPLGVLILLFFGSGCCALIYEIVWFQLLELIIGSSAISLRVLLATFMGGMCLGSLFSPRLIGERNHPVRMYALLEVGIGILGILVLFGLPYAGGLYVAYGGRGFAGLMLRGAVCGLFLLSPTFLIGATLPTIARWWKMTPNGVSWLGFLYSGNIAGGAFGSLAAGFYLLREYDMATATYVAASINGATALAAWLLAKVVDTRFENPESRVPIVRVQGTATVYVAIALSGLCALGAEVIWTRVLSLILGGTVYTFSLILAVFLIGLGIGAYAGSAILRRSTQPAPALAFCQLLLTVAVAWSAYMLSHSLPYWPVYPALSISPWISFQVDFVRCMLAVLPATLLWGASFPLALASAAGRNQDWANLIARIYAANTAGAIAGALVFSLAFIKWLGTERSEQTLMGISFAAGLIMLTSSPLVRRKVWATGAVIVSVLLILTVSPVPPALTAYGRLLPLRMGLVDPKTRTHVAPDILYQGDGLNASVAVSLSNGDVRNFHVSGKVEASSALKDMQLQRMLGYIPLMFHPRPRSILVVGFGAGVTAGTFVLHPGVEKIVICEIEPLIPQVVSRYFEKENNSVLHDPRVRLIYDDARHYILTTDEKFDIITSDPIHPWVKGSAALYTQEYFDLVRRHLNPGGIVSQWVPLYDTGKRTVKSELATFFRAFPNGTLWSTYLKGFGQDLGMMGGGGAYSVNVDDANLQLYRPESAAMTKSLREVGFTSAIELFGTYTGRAVDLMPWLNDAEINHDRSLRLQYTAGSELNLDEGLVMYEEMIGYRKFPADLFAGSKALAEEVKYAIGRRK